MTASTATATVTASAATAKEDKALAAAAKRILAGGPYAPKAGSIAAVVLAGAAGDHSVALPPKAYRAPVVAQEDGSFRKVRANGTTRNIPLFPAGTVQRDTAEAMQASIDGGASFAATAAAFHVSVPTVRRMLASLALTIAQGK